MDPGFSSSACIQTNGQAGNAHSTQLYGHKVQHLTFTFTLKRACICMNKACGLQHRDSCCQHIYRDGSTSSTSRASDLSLRCPCYETVLHDVLHSLFSLLPPTIATPTRLVAVSACPSRSRVLFGCLGLEINQPVLPPPTTRVANDGHGHSSYSSLFSDTTHRVYVL